MAKRYTDIFRAGAILEMDAAGYPNTPGALRRISDHLNVPERTLQRWHNGTSNPPPDNIVATVKQGIVDILDDIIYGAAREVKRRIDTGEIQEASLSQVMTTIGIGVDKKQLLTGQPTERVATVQERLAQLPEDKRALALARAEEKLNELRSRYPQ